MSIEIAVCIFIILLSVGGAIYLCYPSLKGQYLLNKQKYNKKQLLKEEIDKLWEEFEIKERRYKPLEANVEEFLYDCKIRYKYSSGKNPHSLVITLTLVDNTIVQRVLHPEIKQYDRVDTYRFISSINDFICDYRGDYRLKWKKLELIPVKFEIPKEGFLLLDGVNYAVHNIKQVVTEYVD